MSFPTFQFQTLDFDALCAHEGKIVLFADDKLDAEGRRLNTRTKGALARALASDRWAKLKAGDAIELAFPAGLSAQALILVRLSRTASDADCRKAGAAIAKAMGESDVMVVAKPIRRVPALVEGLALRLYTHQIRMEAAKTPGAVICAVADTAATQEACQTALARAEAVHFTRDLTNDPANILTTSEFAARIEGMRDLGLEVEILGEPELEALGMRALLGVGQGSESPSKVAIMTWKGADGAPLALVGKGVVFDTGGISIKPAAGMEEMVMDMGGAGVVAGVMRLLAKRKAKAHVVGLVGLVENMPDGRAQRPGDVVRSMKGDTIEVINTDAEGRLVLADVIWYAQERFKPKAVIDLATLTGAIMVALGYENAGVFSNNDALCNDLLKACEIEGEGAWRMPLGPAYDALIKSRVADMKNTGGRWGGAVTAAQFIQRFVKKDMPWVHIDIAGVAMPAGETELAPKGASGWGVRALDTLIRTRFES